jgi:hypothetical protein
MVGVVLGIVGAGIVGLAVVDMVKTTLVLRGGGGPLAQPLAQHLWRLALRRHAARPSRRSLAGFVYVILFTLILVWLGLLWAGWSLVFTAGESAVLDTQTHAPASLWSRVYFAGYSLITLGVGDFRPSAPPWQLLTVLAAANGFFVVTLTITYLAPLLSAITEKRRLAAQVFGLGETPVAILEHAWSDGNLGSLEPFFVSLSSTIALHDQRHLAYPLLFYAASESRSASDAVALAVLDEALTMLEIGVAPEHRPGSLAHRSVRHAVSSYLDMRAPFAISEVGAAPPVVSLAALRIAGLPVVSDDAFSEGVALLVERRRRLLALVQDAGWPWDAVHGGRGGTDGQAAI